MNKRKYKIAGFVIVVFLITIALLSIHKEEPKEINIEVIEYNINHGSTLAPSDRAPITFPFFVNISTNGLIGEYVKCQDLDDVLEFEFKIKEKLYGDFSDEKTVKVRQIKHMNQYVNTNSYKAGHEYLLLLYKDDSLFLEYPKYELCGLTVMDLSDIDNARWARGTLEITSNANKTDIIYHVKKTASESGFIKQNATKVFRSENDETVIKNCDLILKIKPKMLVADGELVDCSTYYCVVIDSLKGDYKTNEDGVVIIRTLKHALDSGEECIIALSNTASDICYDQASPICIFDADDSEMEAKIKGWLSEKNVP